MTGIVSICALILLTSQLGVPQGSSAPSGLKGLSDGWKIDLDGSLSYIVQLSPETASEIATRGEEVRVQVPESMQGVAQNVVIRIGNGPVERELTEDQLRSRQRSRGPGDQRNAGLSNLNSLSDRASGEIVPIDPLRSAPPMRSTGNSSANARSTENDLAMQAPSMQTPFAAPPSSGSSRNGFNNGETLPPTLPPSLASPTVGPSSNTIPYSNNNSGFNNNNNLNSGNNRNGTYPNTPPSYNNQPTTGNNGSYAGQNPPHNYTGGNVTVTGTSTNDRFADSRFGNTNPFATGTFGGANNYPSNNFPNNNYPTNNGGFANNLPLQSNSQYLPGMNPMPSTGMNNGGNNNWGYGMNNNGNSNYPSGNTVLANSPGMGYQNGPYAGGGYNGLGQYNANSGPPLLAQANLPNRYGSSFPPSNNQDLNGFNLTNRRATISNDWVQLPFVISLVLNAYLIFHLSSLFNSYRTLQISKRADGIFASDL